MNSLNLPPYGIYPVATSSQVILRQLGASDLAEILEISVYDSIPASSEAEALEMLEKIEADYFRGESVHWGIEDATSHMIVGTCGYYRGLAHGVGELGCVLRPGFRGQGYMTAAMQLAINFGFQHIGLQKIIAITSKRNQKAIQLLTRMQFEGPEPAGADEDDILFTLQLSPPT